MIDPIYKRIVAILKIDTKRRAYELLQRAITFILIDFTWLFFRANSFRQSFEILHKIIRDFRLGWFLNLNFLYIGSTKLHFIILLSLFIIAAIDFAKDKEKNIKKFIFSQQIIVRWGIYWCIFMLIIYWGRYGTSNGQTAFIYFQF